jgi:hypothetical protein
MARPAPHRTPVELIGSIPRPADLIERVGKSESKDANLALRHEAQIRGAIGRRGGTGSAVVGDDEQCKYHNFCAFPCMDF